MVSCSTTLTVGAACSHAVSSGEVAEVTFLVAIERRRAVYLIVAG
jgi:hypothetical protein